MIGNGSNLLVQEIEKTNGVDFARPYRLAYAGLDGSVSACPAHKEALSAIYFCRRPSSSPAYASR